MDYTVSITIDAPAERVWSVLTDVEHWPEWTASISSIRRLEQGTFGVGSRVSVKQPKLATAIWTLSDMEPDRSFTWTAVSSGITSVGVHQISPGPSGSVTVTLSVRQTGLLAPIVGVFASGLTRRYIQMEAEGLKRRCEASSLAPAA